VTGDRLATDDGDVTIQPINHATLVLGWKDRVIYVDPVGGESPFQGLPRADLVLVAHNHGDHCHSATIEVVRKPNSILIAPEAVCRSLPAALKSLAIALTNGASTNVLGLKVEAVPAYNLTASFHPKGAGNGYVLTIGGRRLYIAGDTEDIPEMRTLKNIDVAFLPMNLPFTMSVDKAASAVLEFRPKIVYPYHFRNRDGTPTDLESFKRQVAREPSIEVRLRKWY
jgi:L-ascorbate metabolism protein UlaG (beta-lactamase superfamily)